ncbi:MAG: dihydrolipoamide acetyltransferase family protein [Armatimonadota bacterium]
MAELVRMPLMGETMKEGTITRWHKSEGDTVQRDEPVLEVMTDKVNMDVEAPRDGTILKILQPVDAVVPVQGPLFIIGNPGEDISALLASAGAHAPAEIAPRTAERPEPAEAPSTAVPETGAQTQQLKASPRARKVAEELGVDISLLAGKGTGPEGRVIERDVRAFAPRMAEERVRISPLAQRIAAEEGIRPQELIGTGPGGKITREDVIRAARGVPQAPAPAGEVRRVPLSGLRRMVAENVARSFRTAPHVNLVMEVDMTEAVKLREQMLADLEARYGVRLSYTDLIVKAAALALRDRPNMNCTVEDDALVFHPNVNVGVAVSVPDGLVVPVVRDADRKSLPELSALLKELASKAREGRLSADELAGGTFTVTNLGPYGVDSFTPIINPPQCAILGVGRIAEKVVLNEGRAQTVPVMKLCLSFDHRAVDGAPAAEFLSDVKGYLERPYRLLV